MSADWNEYNWNGNEWDKVEPDANPWATAGEQQWGEGGAVSTSGWAAGVYFVEAAAGGVRSVGMVAVGR